MDGAWRVELFVLVAIGVVFFLWRQSKKSVNVRTRGIETSFTSIYPSSDERPSGGRQRISFDAPVRALAPESPIPVTPTDGSAAFTRANELADQALMKHYGIIYRNGRYAHGGFGFSTLSQAIAHAKQKETDPDRITVRRPAHNLPSEHGEPKRTAVQPLEASEPPRGHALAEQVLMNHHGIILRDRRYIHGGYGFSSLSQAIAHSNLTRGDLPSRQGAGAASVKITAPRQPPPRPISLAPEQHPAPRAQVITEGPPRWVATGEKVLVGDLAISAGLFYFGTASSSDWRAENCLIDPSLAVAPASADSQAVPLPYWPKYRDLGPDLRHAYLEWLAGGRRDPSAEIGLVFLFFYGLERRLFVDRAFSDAQEIIEEVQTLLSIYGADHSFDNYGRKLLDTAELIRPTEIVRPVVGPPETWYFEMPMPVRRYLGTMLAQGRALDADDALLWVLSQPQGVRKAVSRCFDELLALWRLRFNARYPAGLQVQAPKQKLESVYRSASGRFETTISLGDLPDIARVTAPLNRLRKHFDTAVEDLSAFSRLVGRKPEARTSLEGALCLPKDLDGPSMSGAIAFARTAITDALGQESIGVVSVQRVASILGLDLDKTKLTVSQQRQLGAMLDRLDFAYEPDRRYGETGLTPDGQMMIYAADCGSPVDPESAPYQSARTIVEVAALAATVDGEVVEAEVDQIREDLNGVPELSLQERLRLLVWARHVLAAPPKQQAALSRLTSLPEDQRRRVSAAAIGAILADGRVQPAEVRFLEKLHKTLNLPLEEVYAALHRGAVELDAPVVVRAEEPGRGIAIPISAAQDRITIALDQNRLERLRQETTEVASLLAGIFSEDGPPEQIPAVALPTIQSAFDGLEARHAELLSNVLASGRADRITFDTHARGLKLLPDGAIETINDWAFEIFGEAVLEDGEELALVPHFAADLRAMERSI